MSQFNFPFDHVVLLTNINPKTHEVECLSISLGSGYCPLLRGGHGVRFGKTEMRLGGYSYFRLDLTKDKYLKLTNICKEIAKRPTSFDHRLQFRLKTPTRPTKDQPKWICSQLVGFVLQEVGVISPGVNTSRLSPTEVFLLLLSPDERRCQGAPCEDPFRRGVRGETSETVYNRYSGARLNPDQRILMDE